MAQPVPKERVEKFGKPLKAANDSGYGTLELRKKLDSRLSGLINDRMSYWLHWREIADYIIPRRYKWLINPNQANRGSPINQRIIDNTGTRALRILASGMMAGITSPGRPWFRLTLDDPDLAELPPVKIWLDEVARRMRTVYAESNFYTSLGTLYSDLGAFGTGVMMIVPDFKDVIRCYNTCAGEYFLANNERMAVDVLFRQFVLTTQQMVDKFGLENCSPDVQRAIEQGGADLQREHVIAHAIEPNGTRDITDKSYRGMEFKEYYWQWGQSQATLLYEGGIEENCIIAARWDIVGNDAYGRGPGMDALGDIKQLQVEQKRKAQAIDKMVNPPMIADVALQNQPATLLPGGVTYVTTTANGVGFKPAYEVNPRISELMEDIKEVQDRVNNTFFADLFLMISQLETVRTATEIDARKEEKLIQLGPVLERFENEALDPSINRTFNIMLRNGLLPPIPPELAGKHVKTEYISMLAQAQKAAMTAGLERFAQFVGSTAGAVPGNLDNVDWDELIDQYADLLGVSPKVVRSMQQVMKIRADRAKQQQQQAEMQQTVAGVQGAQVLSQTEVGGGKNALGMMLGTQ